jgi:hypothetical protein
MTKMPLISDRGLIRGKRQIKAQFELEHHKAALPDKCSIISKNSTKQACQINHWN